MVPVQIALSEREAAIVEEQGDRFSELGFEVVRSGLQGVSVRRVPNLLASGDVTQLVRDVIADPAYAPVVKRMEEALLARLNPAEVDARAKKRQAEVLAAAGGWDFAWKRGDLPFSPPPGVAASWS